MFSFLFNKNKKVDIEALTNRERRRLRAIPRYQQNETKVFGIPVFINDACTLLADVDGIINKEIYAFYTESSSPLIIDCGANIGMSVVYFKRLYPHAKVIAFEPDPILFKLLSKNMTNFNFENVELQQSAVWLSDQGVDFSTEGGHSGHISESDNDENIVSVSSVRLKNLLSSLDSVNMLKMDIEGAEADVLVDCGQMLSICKHIFIEYHSSIDKKQELHDILKLFSDMGYRYHVQEAYIRQRPFVDTNCMLGMDLQLNLFFIKE